LICTQLIESKDDDKYCTAVADTAEEAGKLVATGFEYVCTQRMECSLENENNTCTNIVFGKV
jgi:hypothetical protein